MYTLLCKIASKPSPRAPFSAVSSLPLFHFLLKHHHECTTPRKVLLKSFFFDTVKVVAPRRYTLERGKVTLHTVQVLKPLT